MDRITGLLLVSILAQTSAIAELDMCNSTVLTTHIYHLVYQGAGNGTQCGCKISRPMHHTIVVDLQALMCGSRTCNWKLSTSDGTCKQQTCCTNLATNKQWTYFNDTSDISISFDGQPEGSSSEVNIDVFIMGINLDNVSDPNIEVECGLQVNELSTSSAAVCTTTTSTTTTTTTTTTTPATTTNAEVTTVANSTETITSTMETTTTTSTGNDSLILGAVIGGSAAALVVLTLIIVILSILFSIRKKRKQKQDHAEADTANKDEPHIAYSYSSHLQPPPERDATVAYAYNNPAYTRSFYDDTLPPADYNDSPTPPVRNGNPNSLYSLPHKTANTDRAVYEANRLPRQPSQIDDVTYATDFIDQEFDFIDNDYSSRPITN